MKQVQVIIKKNRLLILILVLASLLRFIGLVPNVAHPDEPHVQIFSRNLVRDIIVKGDFNPHTFKYVFYLQALAYFPILVSSYLVELVNTWLSSSFTSQPLDFSHFHEIAVSKYGDLLLFVGRGEVAVIGVLSVLVIYFIAKELFNKKVALLSSLFLAIAPLHVRDSHYITTDILSLLLVLVALLFAIYQIKRGDLKWFALSGFFIGLSATIRYFPVAILLTPISFVLSFEKGKSWRFPALLHLLFIFAGVFIGLPFLFLDQKGPSLLFADLERYALPWYSTSISNYVFAIFSFVAAKGAYSLPPLSSLHPTFFRPFHASYVFFSGFGILPTISALLGIIALLRVGVKKFLILIPIPLFTFIYVTAYIPASYERTIIPILPFLAIFSAIFFDKLKTKKVILTILVVIAVLEPLMKSSWASISCNMKDSQKLSADFVAKNILDHAKIGYLTMVSVPSTKPFDVYYALEPDYDLSLEYAFINGGRLDYVTYRFFTDFFIADAKLFENSYYSLVFSEYVSRAKLLGVVSKSSLCDAARIYYFELPDAPENKKKVVLKSYDFEKEEDLGVWTIDDFGQEANAQILFENGVLKYRHGNISYTPPKLMLELIPASPGETYTFSALVKSELANSRGYLRMDYYDGEEGSLGKILLAKIKKTAILVWEGPTPAFFEKKRRNEGGAVALSKRMKLTDTWQKIEVSAKATEKAKYLILSFQTLGSDAQEVYIDDVELSKTTN